MHKDSNMLAVYWTAKDQEALEFVAAYLKAQGLVPLRANKPSLSAVLRYLVEEKARSIEAEESDHAE